MSLSDDNYVVFLSHSDVYLHIHMSAIKNAKAILLLFLLKELDL